MLHTNPRFTQIVDPGTHFTQIDDLVLPYPDRRSAYLLLHKLAISVGVGEIALAIGVSGINVSHEHVSMLKEENIISYVMHNDVMSDVSDDGCTCYHMPGLTCCNLHLIVTKGLCRLLQRGCADSRSLLSPMTHRSSICVPSLPRSLICLDFHPNRRFG